MIDKDGVLGGTDGMRLALGIATDKIEPRSTNANQSDHGAMNMLNRIAAALALSLATGPALAAAMLTVSDGTNSITIEDQGAGDTNPVEGVLTLIWTTPDTLWLSTVSVGTTYPADGSASAPYMDLNAVATSTGAGTLTLTFVQSGFLPAATTFQSDVGGTLNQGASALFTAMAAGQSISSIGPFSSAGAFSGSDSVAFSTGVTPYSISLQAVITHGSAGTSTYVIISARANMTYCFRVSRLSCTRLMISLRARVASP